MAEMRDAPGYGEDLALALRLADAADAISSERFLAADLTVSQKHDHTFVTDADQQVERAIRQVLHRERPRDGVFGEEMGQDPGATDPQAPQPRRQWVIDPIDGTHNFMRAVPVWATLIALLVDDEPVVGVVSAPALGRRWWAAQGSGAFTRDPLHREARRLRVSTVAEVAQSSLSYSSLTGWEQIGHALQFADLLRRCWRTRGYGDFWSYMLVAEGAADIACEPILELYDLAALIPIVTEAGGHFTGIDGTVNVHAGNALATNALLHQQVVSILGF